MVLEEPALVFLDLDDFCEEELSVVLALSLFFPLETAGDLDRLRFLPVDGDTSAVTLSLAVLSTKAVFGCLGLADVDLTDLFFIFLEPSGVSYLLSEFRLLRVGVEVMVAVAVVVEAALVSSSFISLVASWEVFLGDDLVLIFGLVTEPTGDFCFRGVPATVFLCRLFLYSSL